MTDINKII